MTRALDLIEGRPAEAPSIIPGPHRRAQRRDVDGMAQGAVTSAILAEGRGGAVIGPLIVGALGVFGILAAIIWFCWQVQKIYRENPRP